MIAVGYFKINSISKLEKLNNAKVCLEDKLLDHGGNYMAVGVAKLLQVLDEGIGSRIRMLAVQLKPSPQVGHVNDGGLK